MKGRLGITLRLRKVWPKVSTSSFDAYHKRNTFKALYLPLSPSDRPVKGHFIIYKLVIETMHTLDLFTGITMAVLLSSALSNPKPFASQRYLPSKQLHCRRILFTASCRAASTLAPVNGSASDFYEVLSLSNNGASLGEIKQAYRSMALRYHPDVCDPAMKNECTRIFVELSVAYKTLSDPLLREEYDSSFSSSRKRWRDQIDELKRRSCIRMAQEEGSWGTRMRAQNTTS